MAIRLGDEAPDFTAETTLGMIHFHEWKGSHWAVLFSHPADFTPVCTTELGALATLEPDFAKRQTKVLALSVDPLVSHYNWLKDIKDVCGSGVTFPIIADPNRWIAGLYGMIHPNTSTRDTVRSTFVIDPEHRVKVIFTYPDSVGRNFQELLRVIDALQLSAKHGVLTPADWREGEAVIVPPHISSEDAFERYAEGLDVKKPYLRLIPEPGHPRRSR